ncbi:MAG: hypothetical protein GY789_02165 [Hyphomicrobiales bacterium]|nr:hypothetical protein [Hyphomicrobiales bacterium]
MIYTKKHPKAETHHFVPVRMIVSDVIHPHEAHAARYVAHPNAARVWKGRV